MNSGSTGSERVMVSALHTSTIGALVLGLQQATFGLQVSALPVFSNFCPPSA
jgi:hypothetical protein